MVIWLPARTQWRVVVNFKGIQISDKTKFDPIQNILFTAALRPLEVGQF